MEPQAKLNATATSTSTDITFTTAHLTSTPTKCKDQIPFAYKLIEYIMKSYRLLFVDKAEIWQDFYTDNRETTIDSNSSNSNSNIQTPAELAEYFTQNILPNILEFQLTCEQQRITELLNLHPEYERITCGYKRVSTEKRVASTRAAQPRTDFHEINSNDYVQMMENLLPGKRKLDKSFTEHSMENRNPPTFEFKKSYKMPQQLYGYRLAQENAALLSAALSADYELSTYSLFKSQELHKRLRAAKQQFEDQARLPENCNDTGQLIKKLKDIKDMREAMADVVEKQFQFHADLHDCAVENDQD